MSQVNDAYWMPFTARNGFMKDPRMIARAEGAFFYSEDGRKVFDSLSGLWCTGLGHGRPEIAEAVAQQISTLDYSPAFQYAHESVFKLADKLTGMAPAGLNHAFFTNSGSEAADTSLKIARAYWRLAGQPTKTKFIGRIRGYHGVNFAGTSLGGLGPNRKLFGQLADADHLPTTLRKEDAFTRGQPQGGAELADELENLVALHDASNIAAVIVEPMSGSGGVIVPPTSYLQRLRELCDKHNILLIFDEVITGFARTGDLFGADTFGVIPDMMNLAKTLTNGVIPMGAVLAKSELYEAFVNEEAPDHAVALPHGYTYSGHSVACAAALASLDIMERDEVCKRSRALAPALENALHGLRDEPHLTDIRNVGLAGALQFAPRDGDPLVRPYEVGHRCWELGVYVRWGGDTLQFAPPFISEASDIEYMGEVLRQAINETK